jgi:L-ascorbate metabolism protein UlaG (beta-lactamase superfamily)
MRIAHLGDLGHLMGESEMEKLGRIDILMIPVGGHFTIDSQDAWDIINHMKPKIVIPMHYKTEKLGFPIAGVGEFLSGTDKVQHVDDLDLSRSDLPQDTTVYVLKHKR